MLNVVAMLQQRSGHVLITSDSDVVTMSETDVHTTLILDRVTTLSQRRCASCATDVKANVKQEKILQDFQCVMQKRRNDFFDSNH